MNADKTAYLNSADVTTKTTGVAPGKFTVQFTPFTSVVGNAAKKTVTITSDKAIFGATKTPTVACKSTKNESAEDTTASALKDGYTIVAAAASSASANSTT